DGELGRGPSEGTHHCRQHRFHFLILYNILAPRLSPLPSGARRNDGDVIQRRCGVIASVLSQKGCLSAKGTLLILALGQRPGYPWSKPPALEARFISAA